MLPSRRVLCPLPLLVLALLAGCSDGTPTDEDPDDPDPPVELVRGFSLSPEGFPADFSRLGAFFDEVGSLGRGTVMFNGLWRDDPAGNGTSGTVPAGATLVASEADGHDYTPVSVFGWRSGETLFLRMPDDPTNDWTNVSARDAFIDMVTAYAAQWEPRYVFLGNETDFYFEQEPGLYRFWVDAYRQMYVAIKDASPNTLVGTVFNVEHMTGRGALVGWTSWGSPSIRTCTTSVPRTCRTTTWPRSSGWWARPRSSSPRRGGLPARPEGRWRGSPARTSRWRMPRSWPR